MNASTVENGELQALVVTNVWRIDDNGMERKHNNQNRLTWRCEFVATWLGYSYEQPSVRIYIHKELLQILEVLIRVMDWISLLILLCIAIILCAADWLFIRFYLSELEKTKSRIGFIIVVVQIRSTLLPRDYVSSLRNSRCVFFRWMTLRMNSPRIVEFWPLLRWSVELGLYLWFQ